MPVSGSGLYLCSGAQKPFCLAQRGCFQHWAHENSTILISSGRKSTQRERRTAPLWARHVHVPALLQPRREARWRCGRVYTGIRRVYTGIRRVCTRYTPLLLFYSAQNRPLFSFYAVYAVYAVLPFMPFMLFYAVYAVLRLCASAYALLNTEEN